MLYTVFVVFICMHHWSQYCLSACKSRLRTSVSRSTFLSDCHVKMSFANYSRLKVGMTSLRSLRKHRTSPLTVSSSSRRRLPSSGCLCSRGSLSTSYKSCHLLRFCRKHSSGQRRLPRCGDCAAMLL